MAPPGGSQATGASKAASASKFQMPRGGGADFAKIPATTERELYFEYEYEVSGLSFDQYQIKIVFVSPNQAYSPIVKDFRAIALAV